MRWCVALAIVLPLSCVSPLLADPVGGYPVSIPIDITGAPVGVPGALTFDEGTNHWLGVADGWTYELQFYGYPEAPGGYSELWVYYGNPGSMGTVFSGTSPGAPGAFAMEQIFVAEPWGVASASIPEPVALPFVGLLLAGLLRRPRH